MKTDGQIPDNLIFLFFNTDTSNKKPNLTGNIYIDEDKKRIALWKRSERKYGGHIQNEDRSRVAKVELFKCRNSEKKAIFKILGSASNSEPTCYLLYLVDKNNKTYYRGVKKAMPNTPNPNN